MTDQGEHTPTAQETQLYDALTAGDHDTIEQLRTDAYAADQTPPDPTPDDWATPAETYEADYQNAWNHYQGDHEAPAPARVIATAADVKEENTNA